MKDITITNLYERLTSKFGKETAENMSSFIDFKITQEMNNHLRVLATKVDMAEAKAEIIKWMFVFWVGQLLAIFGLIELFVKK